MTKSIAILGVLLCASAAWADSITVGTANSSNAFPFGGPAFGGIGTRYQQVYDASSFAGPITITGLGFVGGNGGDFRTANYELSLSTTSRAVNTIDGFLAATNVGADETVFFDAVLSGASPTTLSFTVPGFAYDPSLGNLLLDVELTSLGALPAGSKAAYDEMTNSGGLFSRAHNFGTGFDDRGLVTLFEFDQGGGGGGTDAEVVPEPGTLLLVSLVLGGWLLRRRRRPA